MCALQLQNKWVEYNWIVFNTIQGSFSQLSGEKEEYNSWEWEQMRIQLHVGKEANQGTFSDVTVQNHFGTKRSVATLFQFVARFARVRIEDSSWNRFALNGIQRDFSGGIFSVRIFSGRILSGYHFPAHSINNSYSILVQS